MSTKRQPAKQRRQTQNQRQRAALEARRANAAAAGAVAEGKVGGGGSAGSGSRGGGSLFSRLRGSAATGRTARTGSPAGGQPVGYRAALSALLAAVAAAVVGAVMIQVAVDASGEPVASPGAMAGEWTLSASDALADNPGATAEELADAVDDWTPNGEEPYGQAYFPMSLGLVLPIIGAGLAFRAVSKRAPAKVVNRAMYVTLFGTLLNAQLLFIFLPTVIGVGIAAFQVRKAEVQAAAAAGDADGEPVDDGGVIDVDEVEVEADEVEADELAEDDSFLDAEDAAVPEVDIGLAGSSPEGDPPPSGLGRLRRGRPGPQ
jgi:hypothetical protein